MQLYSKLEHFHSRKYKISAIFLGPQGTNILGMGSANERRSYYVMPHFTGWAHAFWSLWPQCGKNQFFQMASYILQGIYKTLKSSLDLASAWLTAFFHLQKQPHSPFFYHMCRWFVAIVWGNVWYNHAPLLSNQIISILGLRINWISLCLKFCSYRLSNFKMNERSCPSHTSQNSIKCKGNIIYSRVFLIWSWHWSINQTDQVF